MYEKVLVPDVLPNNIRVIRELRGNTVKDLANEINVDRNFFSAVEQESKNFSGKTTITTMKAFGINFYRMYDVNDIRECKVTDDFPTIITKSLSFEQESFFKAFNRNKRSKDIFYIDIDTKLLKDNILFNKEIKKISEENPLLGEYFDFELIDKKKKGKLITLKVNIILTKNETRKMKFDINFTRNENIKLTDTLLEYGFPESIVTWEQLIDGEEVRIENNKLILDSEFKIPKSDDITDYYTAKELELNNVHIKEEKDNLRGGETFKIAKFKAIRPAINNLKKLRTLLNLSIDEMHNSLGLKYTAYLNLELGNQKNSTKTMWRLVMKHRVPLEVLVNVDEYYRRYCKYTKKIIRND